MVKKKRVFYVEDADAQRKSLHLALEWAGFEVESAGTVAAARRLLAENGSRFDVMLLDMKLEKDPEHGGVNGAMLAIEYLIREKPAWRPEFIVLSAFKENEYFEHALQLGVAAYLYKGVLYPDQKGNEQIIGNAEVVRHVRALALRRALSVERPEIARSIGEIVVSSATRFDALARFCRRNLIPELTSCLGMPFFILLKAPTDGNGTPDQSARPAMYCGGDFEWPENDPFFDRLQILAQANANDTLPVEIRGEDLPAPATQRQREMLERLDGSVLLPIAVTNEVRLTIGITGGQPGEIMNEEDKPALVRVLAQYFRSQSIAVLLELLVQVKERIAEQRARLKETAHICLYFGQEQRRSLEETEAAADRVKDLSDFLRNSESFQEAKALAEEAYATGNLLKGLSDYLRPQIIASEALGGGTAVSVAEVIRDAWTEISEHKSLDGIKLIEAERDCSVLVEEADLWVIVMRLLQWLARRRWDTKEDEEPVISVQCAQTEQRARITFEDRSRRLPKELRERLFEPMTLAVLPQGDKNKDRADDRAVLSGSQMCETDSQNRAASTGQAQARPSLGGSGGLRLDLYMAKMLLEVKYGGRLIDRSDKLAGEYGHKFEVELPAAGLVVPVSVRS